GAPQVREVDPPVTQFVGGDAEQGGSGPGPEAEAGPGAGSAPGEVGPGVGAGDQQAALVPEQVHAAVGQHPAAVRVTGEGVGPQGRTRQPRRPFAVHVHHLPLAVHPTRRARPGPAAPGGTRHASAPPGPGRTPARRPCGRLTRSPPPALRTPHGTAPAVRSGPRPRPGPPAPAPTPPPPPRPPAPGGTRHASAPPGPGTTPARRPCGRLTGPPLPSGPCLARAPSRRHTAPHPRQATPRPRHTARLSRHTTPGPPPHRARRPRERLAPARTGEGTGPPTLPDASRDRRQPCGRLTRPPLPSEPGPARAPSRRHTAPDLRHAAPRPRHTARLSRHTTPDHRHTTPDRRHTTPHSGSDRPVPPSPHRRPAVRGCPASSGPPRAARQSCGLTP